MKLFRATVAMLLFAVSPLAVKPAIAQRQQETAIGAIAELIGDALRTAIGEKKPPRAVDVPVAAMAVEMDAGKPAVGDIERRKKRLSAYSAAMQDWIASVCDLTDDQRTKLKAIAEAEIARSQEAFQKKPVERNNRRALSDTFPVKFTIRYGTAQDLDLTRQQKHIKDLLTAEQLEKLNAAIEQRTTFHVDATVQRVLNLLDEQLFLTSTQRRDLADPLKARLKGMESSSFSFFPQSYYYQQTSVTFVLQRGDYLKILNDAQKARARDFAGLGSKSGSYNSEQYVSFQSNEGTDGWHKKMIETGNEQLERVRRACEVRVAFCQAEYGLSERGARHLQIAAKGVADNLVGAWKKTTAQQLKTYEEQAGRFGGNFSFGLQVPDVKKIESDPLWKHTMDSLTTGTSASAYNRDQSLRAAEALYLTALLDKELWLPEHQRSHVNTLVEKCLPRRDVSNPYRNYMEEVAMLVIPLFKLSKQDTSTFGAAQRQAWDTLKEEFDFNGRYATVHVNGSQFTFQIPKD